jgi:hypothetical protein
MAEDRDPGRLALSGSTISTNLITIVLASVLGLAAVVIINRSQIVTLLTHDEAIEGAAVTALEKHDALEGRLRAVEQEDRFTVQEAHELERYLRDERQGEIKMLREHIQHLQDRVAALEVEIARANP